MAECKEIVWSEKLCLDLIREYKSRPVLWDCSYPTFYKQPIKVAEWEKIGAVLDLPAEQCKHKMGILLSSFRREKAKCKNLKKNGKIYRSNWFAYEELSFLLKREVPGPKNKSRGVDPLGNDDDSFLNYHNTTSPNITDMQFDQDDINEYEVKIEAESDMESEISIRSDDHKAGPSNTIHETAKQSFSIQTSTEPQNIEEIIAFTNFIQAKMKKYSERTLIDVQRDICAIIFNADQGAYDKNQDTTNNSDNANNYDLKNG